MCKLFYSIVIECRGDVVWSLSSWETDDENTRAVLPGCSGGFAIDVEQFSFQFNSFQFSSILC